MKVRVFNNLAVGQNHLGRAGFAARFFRKGDVITQFKGPLIHKLELPKNYKGERDRYLQVGVETFMGPSEDIDDLLNHSCDPNTGLKFNDSDVLLVAIRDIEIGEEVTWDYSTTMFEHDWRMKCDCRAKECRKIISDFTLLDKKIQERYRALGIIPQYLENYMNNLSYPVYTRDMRSLKKHAQRRK
ncbi:MAG TPA: SET domain-containing methyltransferase [Candidatus Paceibacterota bacterium]